VRVDAAADAFDASSRSAACLLGIWDRGRSSLASVTIERDFRGRGNEECERSGLRCTLAGSTNDRGCPAQQQRGRMAAAVATA
jgi:hypothetical protein